jgi:hypothetical protein
VSEKPIDRTRCPLCGQPNDCAREKGQNKKDCWCVFETFSADILELVPEDKKGKACICRACLRRFQQRLNPGD